MSPIKYYFTTAENLFGISKVIFSIFVPLYHSVTAHQTFPIAPALESNLAHIKAILSDRAADLKAEIIFFINIIFFTVLVMR